MRILGIDPGIGICGFGVIETTSRAGAKAVDFGAIRTKVDAPMPERLLELYEGLEEVMAGAKAEVMAVEKLFFSKNITTGIAVAEARGVVLLVGQKHGLIVREYTPNQIKMTLTGYGAANKTQMQEMVRVHLGLVVKPKPDDAADALAAAITCGFLYHEDDVPEVEKFSNSRGRKLR
ncbi:crossover junction endodeoxyribonuclease RuvC [Candidatus Saccharibacteria bacterium]|nr:crossover junction endodeoxyribonuclease RuvC [Candidatus Saccharibacteria bacterium]